MAKPRDNGIPPHAPLSHAEAGRDLAFDKGLPSNVDAERFVLGSVMLNDTTYPQMVALLEADDFSMEKHRRIFSRMHDLVDRGEAINRVTLANELMKQGQLESVDGLSYLISLDQGLPELVNLDSYIRIVKEKSNLRKIIRDAQRRMDQAFMDMESKDIAAAGVESLQAIQEAQPNSDDGARNPWQVIEESGGILKFLDPSTRQSGIMTGFTRLDEATNGIHPGQLTLIGARPSVGKTAFALNVAYNVAEKSGKAVHFYSLEMSPLDLLTRLVCSAARVDAHKFRCGFLNSEERRRLQVITSHILEMPLILYDLPGAGVKDVARRTRAWRKKKGVPELGLIIIDYIGLMRTEQKSENRNIALGHTSRGLKLLTREEDIPVWALSQLSRPDKTARFTPPDLQDLRDSGSLEQDADNVGFLWREEMVRTDRQDLKGLADFILRKQRNGPITKIPLRFLPQFTRFENMAEDLPEGSTESDPPPNMGW